MYFPKSTKVKDYNYETDVEKDKAVRLVSVEDYNYETDVEKDKA
ncbi:16147_t:CDS:2, partial [Racocetra persica]